MECLRVTLIDPIAAISREGVRWSFVFLAARTRTRGILRVDLESDVGRRTIHEGVTVRREWLGLEAPGNGLQEREGHEDSRTQPRILVAVAVLQSR